MSNDTATNSCTNLFCTNWRGINSLVEWKYKIIKTNHVGQVIFNSINLIMPHQFVQNKFIQEFVTILLLYKYYTDKRALKLEGEWQIIKLMAGVQSLALPNGPQTKANFVEGRMQKNLPRVAHSCYQSPNGGLPQSVYKYPSTSCNWTFSLGRSFPFDWGYCFSSCQTLTLTLIFSSLFLLP